jgi:hypothetical protein
MSEASVFIRKPLRDKRLGPEVIVPIVEFLLPTVIEVSDVYGDVILTYYVPLHD